MSENQSTTWARDPLSRFIRQANDNTASFFANQPNNSARLAEIDQIFLDAVSLLENSPELLPNFLLFRGHAIFRTAVRLFTAGQHYESYVLLRACLETGLYAFHVAKNPQDVQLWLRRNQSANARSAVKRAFQVKKLLDELELVDGTLHDTVKLLYELAIDRGGHPNPQGLLSMAEWMPDDVGVTYNTVYMSNDPDLMGASFMTTARVAIVTLSLFRYVHPERFEIMGVSQELQRLSTLLFKTQ